MRPGEDEGIWGSGVWSNERVLCMKIVSSCFFYENQISFAVLYSTTRQMAITCRLRPGALRAAVEGMDHSYGWQGSGPWEEEQQTGLR